SDSPDWNAVASAGGSKWNLHRAARDGDWFAVREILDAGVNPDLPDPRGVTPLMSAARYANDAVVSLLLQRGADADLRDDEGYSVLAYAALGGDVRILSDLLTAVEVEDGMNGRPSEVNLRTTPLYYAVITGNHAALGLLTDADYPADAVDEEGINVLMIAAWLGDFYAVSKLLPVTDGVWGNIPRPVSLDDAGRSALDWSLAAFKRDRRSGRDIGSAVKAQRLYPVIRALAYRTRNPKAAATQPTGDVHEMVREAWSVGRNPTMAEDWSMMVPSPVPDVPGDGDLVVYRILRDEEPGIPGIEITD
ncbi:MAG: ankyrin repeat domain-containing protein, partial [Spirochaetaceae bacterium]|nr:ankyrin repeat domain-containing protein [Spirochaetaceae bacterium]